MPSSANAFAIEKPMPDAPPVTKAVFPLNSRIAFPCTLENLAAL